MADPHPRVRRARRAAWLLDESVTLPVVGYEIGLDPILGLIPVVGDAVSALLSLYIVLQGALLGVPKRTLALMLLLVAGDFWIGVVPVAGDALDAVWKANVWNVRLLERAVEA